MGTERGLVGDLCNRESSQLVSLCFVIIYFIINFWLNFEKFQKH